MPHRSVKVNVRGAGKTSFIFSRCNIPVLIRWLPRSEPPSPERKSCCFNEKIMTLMLDLFFEE